MEFALLGPLEARDAGGEVVELGSRRQRALLAMLLLDANRTVPVERIVDGLWGEEPPAKAVASIQSYISNLRRALEPDRAPREPARLLVSRAAGYAVVVERAQLDLLRFEDHLSAAGAAAGADPETALAELETALALWRGPVLGDAHDAPFATPEVARLEAVRWGAEEDRVDLLLRLGRTADAITTLERLVGRDPLRERSQHQLVVALYRAGRQVDALEAHRRHVTVLADEYGLDPSPAYLALRDAVLRHELPSDPPRGDAPPPGAPTRDPVATPVHPAPRPASTLVGRDDELSHLWHVLDRLESGTGAVVLVSGEAGIGKSRLLEATLDEAARRGMTTALGRCYEGGGAPAFWPFVEIARGLVHAADPVVTPVAVDLLEAVQPADTTDHGDGLPAVVGGSTRFLTADRVAAAMRSIASHRPMVVAIDDCYGADPDSLDALVRVGAAAGVVPLVLLATLRTPALPDGHPLASALGELVRMAHVERLSPRPLRVEETGELLARESGTELPPATVSAVHRRTGGNPFFTSELGRLVALRGADPTQSIPAGVRDVLRLLLERLPSETQSVLRVAAVQGRTFTLDIVASVHGSEPLSVLDLLEAAIAAQVVAEDRGRPGTYRFSHVLVQEAIAGPLSAMRRAHLHRDIAAALEGAAAARPELWAEVAHHAVEAVPLTGPAPALAPLTQAAVHAVSVNAHELAQQLVEQRLGAIAELPPGRERDEAELLAQADLCAVLPITAGWQAQALQNAGERVVALAQRLGDLDAEMLGLTALSAQTTVSAQYDRTVDELAPRQQAIVARSGVPTHGFLASHAIAMVHLFQGRLAEAERAYLQSEERLRVADPDDAGTLRIPPDRMAGAAHHASLWAILLWMIGDPEGSRRQLARAHAIATRDGHLQTIWAVWLSHLIASYCDQDAEDVVRGDRERREQAWAFHSPVVDAMIDVPAAWGVARLGDADAVDVLGRRIDELTDKGALVFAAIFRGMLADALLHHGRDDEALAAAEDGLAQADRLGEHMWEAELHRLRAVALQRLGRDDEAVTALVQSRAVAVAQGAVLLAERAARTAVAVGVTIDDPDATAVHT